MYNIPVLIPAYKPDTKLIKLILDLKNLGVESFIIVRDGGGPEYNYIFNQIKSFSYCHLLEHDQNKGKGKALKTGMEYFLRSSEFSQKNSKGLVTADADGQHSPNDIFNIIKNLYYNPNLLVLGARSFDKNVPLRSKIGNGITRLVFSGLTRLTIRDTQTGLRGIPTAYIESFTHIPGDKYEYEMNMLIATKKMEIEFVEIPIETIYIDNNRLSSFRPFIDSVKIYILLAKFAFSAISSFLLDYILFAIIFRFTGSLAAANYLARGASMLFNYTLNRKMVFYNHQGGSKLFFKYLLLAVFSISVSYGLLYVATIKFNFPVLISKFFIELGLFFMNFFIQKKFIFKPKKAANI
ncbi:Bifunctional glycosyltransferase family 2/GtrA family protein [Candidatus Hepatincolaceae symbiont of Richtersius coronifer]